MRHYLMTTDAHFEAALRGGGGEKAAQNPAQQLHAASGKTPQDENAKAKKSAFFRDNQEGAASCDTAETPELAGAGFEPATSGL
jgi:hypothetical protein